MPKLGDRYVRALITGAGSGMGKAFAETLMGQGVAVWGTSRNPEKLCPTETFTPVGLDLEKIDDLPGWFHEWDLKSGGFDLVINNAGFAAFGPAESMAPGDVHGQVRVLLSGPIHLAGAAMKRMRGRGRGCLVNISSVACELWIPYLSVYNAAKAGLSAFSQSLMLESPAEPPWVIDFRAGDFQTAFNQNVRRQSGQVPRAERVWRRMEELTANAPSAARASQDLLTALKNPRHGTYYSGSFFQTRIAPLAFRLFPDSLKRKILRTYFKIP